MAKEKRLVVLSTRVDETLGNAIRQLAEEDGRPVSSYLERLVLRHAIDMGKLPDTKAKKPDRKGRKS